MGKLRWRLGVRRKNLSDDSMLYHLIAMQAPSILAIISAYCALVCVLSGSFNTGRFLDGFTIELSSQIARILTLDSGCQILKTMMRTPSVLLWAFHLNFWKGLTPFCGETLLTTKTSKKSWESKGTPPCQEKIKPYKRGLLRENESFPNLLIRHYFLVTLGGGGGVTLRFL